jgi:hypothetical protein
VAFPDELIEQLLVGWWVVVGLTCIVRALPLIAGWTAKGIKPWACDLCMSFWSAVAFVFVGQALHGWSVYEWVLVPALTGAGIATLSRLTPAPPGGPASFPSLVDQGKP